MFENYVGISHHLKLIYHIIKKKLFAKANAGKVQNDGKLLFFMIMV